MPFIPHTDNDVRAMLDAIGVASIDALFDEIPESLLVKSLDRLPQSLTELETQRLLRARATQDETLLGFLGAGAYRHHIPAAVWEIATRGEFYSAYTPYQAEASQGTLQLLYEFQSMLSGLLAMDVANASLYEGASALAEAVLMALRCVGRNNTGKKLLLPRSVNPLYRDTLASIAGNQGIEFADIAFGTDGTLSSASLNKQAGDAFALALPLPNYFGLLETVDDLTDWAHKRGLLVIAIVNPTAMGLLKPPGNWGARGADIACGEGQPLGVPLASGGPYFGFLACRQSLVRQMPGRIVGRTLDTKGRDGYTLTLQAREQHIRRAKATSNICTNQGLLATAATIYMAVMGQTGLVQVARRCHRQLTKLVAALTSVPGVERLFAGPVFHETVLKLPTEVAAVLGGLMAHSIVGGLDLGERYPELGNALLVCATEMTADEDIERYRVALRQVLAG